jgi:MFS transporter, DHA2 family, multidrug resistance protein
MAELGARRWWALGALVLSVLVVGLDATVLNLALPTLATDLHASNSALQWFADAYNLVFAALLLPAGLLGDRYGRRRLLLGALVVFGVASLGCAYASTTGELITARALLGLGGAFLMPLSMAVLPVMFRPDELPRAMGVWVAATAIAFPIGPIVGGYLLNTFWWGSVFLINVPVTILAVIAVATLLPESRSSEAPRLDMVGVAASSCGLALFTYGVIEAGEKGWGHPAAVATIAAGVVALAAFLAWERRLTARPDGHPLIQLSLFRSPRFLWGTVLATLVSFAMFGMLFVVPQYFRGVNGTGALGSGVRLLPIIGGLLVGSRLATMLPWLGAKYIVAIGFVLLGAGVGMGALTGVSTGYGFIAVWITLVGMGLGFALPATMNAALSALSAERSGVGSGLIMAMRQVGGTIGVAVLGTVLNSAYRGHLHLAGLPAQAAGPARDSVSGGVAVAKKLGSPDLLHDVRSAFVHGMDVMLGVCGGVTVLGLVLTLAFLPRRTPVAAAPAGDEGAEPDHEVVASR